MDFLRKIWDLLALDNNQLLLTNFNFTWKIWKSEFLVKRHKSSIVQLALLRQGWNFLLDLLLYVPLAQLGGNLIVLLFQLLFLFRKLAFIFWQILLKIDISEIFMIWVENSRWTIPYWRGWDIPPSTWRERPSWCPPGGRAAVSSRTQTSTGLLCWRTRHHVKTRKQNFNLLLSVSSHKDVVLGGLLLQEQRDTNPGLLHQVLLDQHSQWQIYSSSIKVKTTITT